MNELFIQIINQSIPYGDKVLLFMTRKHFSSFTLFSTVAKEFPFHTSSHAYKHYIFGLSLFFFFLILFVLEWVIPFLLLIRLRFVVVLSQ